MIVTRKWLSEFIDLSAVSNEKLYETFNAIGLEVDSLEKIEIASKVVIGKILSCEKHPDADKLNVCQIDVGSTTLQIVCGAKNVMHAKYVAVATVGAVLPDNFEIKDAKLRGVESAGMVCASSELGLPSMGKGIMILDESIGELVVGKELNSYEMVSDTIIGLELTANRGDCLSILGVARDLASALNLDMLTLNSNHKERVQIGIGREAELKQVGKISADLEYRLAKMELLPSNFLIDLRLAMVGVDVEGKLASILAYATHSTGVILHAYDASFFRNSEDKILVIPTQKSEGITEIRANNETVSLVGVEQNSLGMAKDESREILIEASYAHPDSLVEAVSTHKLKRDDKLYYKTSRGSNPQLNMGLVFLGKVLFTYSSITCYEGSLNVEVERENKTVIISSSEISSLIGMKVESSQIVSILRKLDFKVSGMADDNMAVTVPLFRHDIRNIQDITEEIVRIIGINNIEAKALVFTEKPRLNATTNRYASKKSFKNRAVGLGFYENVSYVFSDSKLLEKYHFSLIEEALDIANPIAQELDTLRSTILINLLLASKRNIGYSLKSIPLFEIGSVFKSQREEREVMSFVFSGQNANESVLNAGKPENIDFATFTQKIAKTIGNFELLPCSFENGLIHPYQSADVVIDGKVCGFISKLHPIVQEEFGIPVTFIAEIDFDSLLPQHINAKPISNFQGVYKDLSIVIDKTINYFEVAKVINALKLEMLKDSYPIDIYEDDTLGDKKSLTVRFFIQSMEKTLEENDIEGVMNQIMNALTSSCNAELR